jgi:hypothetical protein
MVESEKPCFFNFFVATAMGSLFLKRLPDDDEDPFDGLAATRNPSHHMQLIHDARAHLDQSMPMP